MNLIPQGSFLTTLLKNPSELLKNHSLSIFLIHSPSNPTIYFQVLLIRSFIASFILLTSAHKSVNEGRRDQILLPNGHFIDKDTPLSAFHEEFDTETKAKEKQWMEARIK